MMTWIFLLVVILAAGLVGWLGYRYYRGKKPTPRDLLLEQLCQVRLEIARSAYREDCYQQFACMSGGIQDLLAQERRSYKKETAFCRRIVVAGQNSCLDFYLKKQVSFPEPKPISPEEAVADFEMLKLIIQDEEKQVRGPKHPMAWDALLQELQPCLGALLQAAREEHFQTCHSGLVKLEQVLKRFEIYPLWYEDAAVQENFQLQLKYAAVGEYPVPVLCRYVDEKYDAVGTIGCIGNLPQ